MAHLIVFVAVIWILTLLSSTSSTAPASDSPPQATPVETPQQPVTLWDAAIVQPDRSGRMGLAEATESTDACPSSPTTREWSTAARSRFAHGLKHRTDQGERVRSKSELVIANLLSQLGLPYAYERFLPGSTGRRGVCPDFSFVGATGELIVWEHLGMLHDAGYRGRWLEKQAWYRRHGFVEGRNLFTSSEDADGALDSSVLRGVAMAIKARLV